MVDPATATFALNVVKEVGAQMLETIEREQTNRARIAAQAMVIVEEIRARRNILAEAVREQAQVRRHALSELSDLIENAANAGDVSRLQRLIGAFVQITLSDPIESILEMDRQLREGSFILRLSSAQDD